MDMSARDLLSTRGEHFSRTITPQTISRLLWTPRNQYESTANGIHCTNETPKTQPRATQR